MNWGISYMRKDKVKPGPIETAVLVLLCVLVGALVGVGVWGLLL